MTAPTDQPTQVQHPWRSTLRTVIVATLALLPALPEVVHMAGLDTIPWVVATLAVAAGAQRLLVMPAVHDWIVDYLPWLAPAPKQPTP